MKALTIHRPWTDAIAYLPDGKRIENRSWKPPRALVGQRIAIHAGKTYDPDAAAFIGSIAEDWHVPGKLESPTGVVATAKLAGYFDDDVVFGLFDPDRLLLAWGGDGQVGWVLEDVVGIPPVPCKGRQGLWYLPGLVERDVLARVEAVRAGLMDPRPANARAWERRAELEALDEVALRRRAMDAGYRTVMPSLSALAFGEVSDEMRREQQQLAERRARSARR